MISRDPFGTDQEKLAYDLDVMDRPLDWPKWPVLPLKLRDFTTETTECHGFLYAFHGQPKSTVYIGTLSQTVKVANELAETGRKILWEEVLTHFKKRDFRDMAELASVYTVD